MFRIRLAAGCDPLLWRPWCEKIDETYRTAERILKEDVVSTVWLSSIVNQKVVVKRINDIGFKARLRRCFRRSRPMANWENAGHLASIGVPTFIPLAVIEERWGPFNWGKSYLVCSYVDGMSALNYFTQNPLPSRWQASAQEIVDRMIQLRQHQISHRDLNPSNLILSQGKWHLIDLDAMRVHAWPWMAQRYFKRECGRFLENWADTPMTNRDFFDYLKDLLRKQA